MKTGTDTNRKMRKAGVLIFWLLVWQAAGMAIHNSIVFVGPAEVLAAFKHLLPSMDFWSSATASFVRISVGFLSAFSAGILLGGLSFRFSLVRELLDPLILLCKAVPVASFIILALILIGSENLSVLVSFIIVMPVVYANTLAGLSGADSGLLEMAKVFRMKRWRKLRYIYWPPLAEQLHSGCRVAVGMSWKSGTAAEVIGVPQGSIGEKLYMAKIYLNTADLFAWTIVILILSAVFEWAFLKLLRRIR